MKITTEIWIHNRLHGTNLSN